MEENQERFVPAALLLLVEVGLDASGALSEKNSRIITTKMRKPSIWRSCLERASLIELGEISMLKILSTTVKSRMYFSTLPAKPP